jgi:hypothetical protein
MLLVAGSACNSIWVSLSWLPINPPVQFIYAEAKRQ